MKQTFNERSLEAVLLGRRPLEKGYNKKKKGGLAPHKKKLPIKLEKGRLRS
mgnify:CR=1 FL=1